MEAWARFGKLHQRNDCLVTPCSCERTTPEDLTTCVDGNSLRTNLCSVQDKIVRVNAVLQSRTSLAVTSCGLPSKFTLALSESYCMTCRSFFGFVKFVRKNSISKAGAALACNPVRSTDSIRSVRLLKSLTALKQARPSPTFFSQANPDRSSDTLTPP